MRHLVRKALFDILQHVIRGSQFLDLFSGTGGVGLEALSRGAEHVTFVDNLSESVKLIGKNVEKLEYQDSASIYEMDVRQALDKFKSRDRRFDIVFLGPPYEQGLARKTLKQLAGTNLVKNWGIAGAEVFFKTDLPESMGRLEKIDSHDYGQTSLVIYRRKPAG